MFGPGAVNLSRENPLNSAKLNFACFPLLNRHAHGHYCNGVRSNLTLWQQCASPQNHPLSGLSICPKSLDNTLCPSRAQQRWVNCCALGGPALLGRVTLVNPAGQRCVLVRPIALPVQVIQEVSVHVNGRALAVLLSEPKSNLSSCWERGGGVLLSSYRLFS